MQICKINMCFKTAVAKSLCNKHYKQTMKYGAPKQTRFTSTEMARWIYVNKNHKGDDCLYWPFNTSASGYGTSVLFGGKKHDPHRLMCIFAHGYPDGNKTIAAHSCGRGSMGCVNPSHLRWATQKENLADRILHGTLPCGEKHPFSRLNNNDVTRIISLYAAGMSIKHIAKKLNITYCNVHQITSGTTWKHIDRKQYVSRKDGT